MNKEVKTIICRVAHIFLQNSLFQFYKHNAKEEPKSSCIMNHSSETYSALYSKVDRITGSGYLTKLEETQVAVKGNLKSSKSEAQR